MNGAALAVVLTMAAVTVALRALPFLAMGLFKDNAYLAFLGRAMPIGVMTLLVAYTFKDIDWTVAPYGLPELGMALLAALMYWRTRALLLSIGLPLVGYVLLASFVL